MNPAPDTVAADAASAAATVAPATPPRWRVDLLGGLVLDDGRQRLTRLPSRAVTALLARLALAPQRLHPREELAELLWPGVAAAVGRNRLRQALSTLRSVLEPAGAQPPAPVLLADRLGVRVVPAALACDVAAFEQAARTGRRAEAQALYRGELLPGFYDDWIAHERLRLAALADGLGEVRPVPSPPPAAAGAALPAVTPAPLAVPPPAGHGPARVTLPAYLTRLFGADQAIVRLQAQVRQHRLVTLLGPGGAGKTRLAVETARRLAAEDADAGAPPFDRIVFVPWVNCHQAPQALEALAAAVGLRLDGADAVAALGQALAGQRTLLLLDNAEQLADAVAPALAQLLGTVPGLHALVTSRRALGLDGEREMALAALPLPPADADLAGAAANPAVALFVERAQAVRADFHLGPRNAAVLAGLVRALAGMPLAIELAAARVRSSAPAEMLARLRGPGTPGLDLLARSGPRGTHDPRHASMLRTIAWSWDLLPADPQRLLAALTVLPGSFDTATVQALADAAPGDPREILATLVASSLVQRGPAAADADVRADGDDDIGDDGEPHRWRFHLDQPVREYAAQQLDASAARQVRERLRAWALGWAQTLPRTPPLPALRREMPNLVAALASAVDDGAAAAAVQLLLALARTLEDVPLPAEGLAAARAALSACDDSALRLRGLGALAPLLYAAGDAAGAQQQAEVALALLAEPSAGEAGRALTAPQRARVLHAVARVRWRSQRRAEGVLPLLDQAQALLDAAPGGAAADPDLQASLLALRGFVTNHAVRDARRGEQCHAQALACWVQGGNAHAIASGRYNLAVCAHNAGRHADALAQLALVIPAAQAQHDHRRLSQCLNLRGLALGAQRQWPQAVAAYRDCLRIAWQALAPFDLAHGLWNLPRALAHSRQPGRAARLMGFIEAFWAAHYGALTAADRHDLRRVRRLVACQIGIARTEALWLDGRQLALGEAVALALAPADAA